MTPLEAMKQALDALEEVTMYSGGTELVPAKLDDSYQNAKMCHDAIVNLRTAIAEMEHQKPFAYLREGGDLFWEFTSRGDLNAIPVYTHPSIPERQEPVAWMYEDSGLIQRLRISHTDNGIPLYTHPAHADVIIGALKDNPRVQIPEGWQLVPVEPTENMTHTAAWVDKIKFINGQLSWVDAERIYKAMLKAAPKPEDV